MKKLALPVLLTLLVSFILSACSAMTNVGACNGQLPKVGESCTVTLSDQQITIARYGQLVPSTTGEVTASYLSDNKPEQVTCSNAKKESEPLTIGTEQLILNCTTNNYSLTSTP